MFNIYKKIGNDWIQTVDLWYWKQPLYQLSHNNNIYDLITKLIFCTTPLRHDQSCLGH